MTNNIFKNMLITTFAVLALSMALVVSVFYDHMYNQVFNELKNEALIISQGIEKSGDAYLENLKSYNRITLLSPNGTVIYDSVAQENSMANHSDREEFIEAIETGTGKAIRYSSTISGKTLYFSTLLSNGNVIRVASEQTVASSIIKSMIMPIALIVLFAVIVSIYLSHALTKMIIKPILNIDLENPLHTETYDEIAPLLTKIHNQNITIAHQLENLSQKQNEFTAITENMSEGFVLIDKNANILSFNASAVTLLNAENVSVGSSVLVLNRSEAFRNAVNTALNGGHTEVVIELSNRFYQLFASAVIQNSEIAGAVIIIMDITEKEMHDKLRREFSANVSHELKTPLTSISGFAELMKTGMVEKENVIEFSGDIYNEAQRLISLVNDIIHISMLDEENYVEEKTTVSLNAVVDEVFATVKPTADKHGISLISNGNAEIKTVYTILDEIVYNLIDNAVKYNKNNGSVSVSITENENEVILSVSDTGIGIPAEYTGRVFERFFRVDKSHSKEIGGTGLGLSIVKHGAAYIGAEIDISSKVNEGTTISLKWVK